MKVLGAKQLEQKEHKLLPKLPGFEALLGDLAYFFIGIVFGEPGQGKTDFCMQFARALCEHDDVAWLSYEQGHSHSLKNAAKRQDFLNAKYSCRFIDPIDKKKEFDAYEELKTYLGKRSTPKFVFIDSLNYIGITKDQYYELNRLYGHKRSIVFISHAKGKKPDTLVGEKVAYDGEFAIYVKDFLAYTKKNRGGGFTPYVIWEERARELNPAHFALKESAQPEKKKRGRKPKNHNR